MAYPRGESREFYSGRELEIDILGKPKFGKEYELAYKKAALERGYLPYKKAQELIREFYPEDPTNPKKEFARDLRIEICEALGLEGDDGDDVKFYSAVGTPLDVFHGADAWIEMVFDHPEAGKLHAEVTLDATKRPDKLEEGHKADIMVGDVPAPEEKEYLKVVEKYGQEVSDLLFERLKTEAERRKRAVR